MLNTPENLSFYFRVHIDDPSFHDLSVTTPPKTPGHDKVLSDLETNKKQIADDIEYEIIQKLTPYQYQYQYTVDVDISFSEGSPLLIAAGLVAVHLWPIAQPIVVGVGKQALISLLAPIVTNVVKNVLLSWLQRNQIPVPRLLQAFVSTSPSSNQQTVAQQTPPQQVVSQQTPPQQILPQQPLPQQNIPLYLIILITANTVLLIIVLIIIALPHIRIVP